MSRLHACVESQPTLEAGHWAKGSNEHCRQIFGAMTSMHLCQIPKLLWEVFPPYTQTHVRGAGAEAESVWAGSWAVCESASH